MYFILEIRNAIPFIHDYSTINTCCPSFLWMIKPFINRKVAGFEVSSCFLNLSRYSSVFQYFWYQMSISCTCRNRKFAILKSSFLCHHPKVQTTIQPFFTKRYNHVIWRRMLIRNYHEQCHCISIRQ